MKKDERKKNPHLDFNAYGSEKLFELVPCMITVQDRDYRLLKYNQEFIDRFDPKPGDYCYHAYKGRDDRCSICPVESTFKDGRSHWSEEAGINKDGSKTHWVVRTAPIKNDRGEVVAAMELSLDITQKKQLEELLEKSEEKYHAIFTNMPNPVFALDERTLEVLDCNQSIEEVYGYTRDEIIGCSFLILFNSEEQDMYDSEIRSTPVINRASHFSKDGRRIFVNTRISNSDYADRKVYLVTTSDITKSFEAEQQLIQASKMATLGEMATGIAHELNQPLTVIRLRATIFYVRFEGMSLSRTIFFRLWPSRLTATWIAPAA